MATPLNQPQARSKAYWPLILIGCVVLFFGGLVVAGAAGLLFYLYMGQEGKGGGIGFSGSGVKTVDNHGVQTVAKTWSSCTAFAPSDWTMIGNEQRVGIGTDLGAPDKSLASSYGIVAVPRTTMYGTDFYGTGTPETFLQTVLQQNGAASLTLDEATQQIESYTLRYWRATMRGKAVRGFALYQAIEMGDPSTYIVAYRIGSTEAGKWEQYKNLVYDVAASIRCTKHLFPAQESSVREPKGSSKDDIERQLSIKRQEATMGFQNVHSPTTGEHWEASYSDYNATGPDGPGYYRRVGNSYEKLKEGFPSN